MNIFLDKMKALLGDEFDDFLKFYNSSGEHYRGLRVNTLKCSVEKLEKLLDFDLKSAPFCSESFYIPNEITSLGNNPLHHAGAFYIQEPSASSAVTMLDVQEGDYVLDLCAAPGGKSTQIAAKLNSKGFLWSNEIVKNRANILLSNIERMGIRNATVSNAYPEVLCDRLAGCFDKVLVDAPCSGEGMFRKDSTAESEWSDEHVKSCAERQLKILNSAKNALKDGGVMVYSTCTFSVEENEGVIGRFLEENPDFKLEDANVNFGRPTLEYARRIFPMDGGEGHFAARLKKSGELYKNSFTENSKKKIDSKIIVLPQEYVPYEKLPVLRSGIILGQIVKNRIEPHHSAFMAAKADECVSKVDFDVNSAKIKAFLHGEEVAVDNNIKGYTAVCVNGITVGFGKCSNGRLKNKYPKGLRLL